MSQPGSIFETGDSNKTDAYRNFLLKKYNGAPTQKDTKSADKSSILKKNEQRPTPQGYATYSDLANKDKDSRGFLLKKYGQVLPRQQDQNIPTVDKTLLIKLNSQPTATQEQNNPNIDKTLLIKLNGQPTTAQKLNNPNIDKTLLFKLNGQPITTQEQNNPNIDKSVLLNLNRHKRLIPGYTSYDDLMSKKSANTPSNTVEVPEYNLLTTYCEILLTEDDLHIFLDFNKITDLPVMHDSCTPDV
jgi:hypothetical protein